MYMFKTKVDLLNGSITKSLLTFAVPLLLANACQHLYVTADMMIVGYFLGEASLAAIGAGAVIFELLIGFAIGVGGGFGIVLARNRGAGNEQMLKRAVAGSFVQGFILVTTISVAASLGLKPLLRLLDTPPDIIDDTYSYISILVAFAFVLFLNNLCAGFLRAVGNSFTPLMFLMFSSVLNIGLDFLFIVVFNMNLRGVAAATVVAQSASALLCIVYIFKKCPELVPRREHFRPDPVLYRDLATQGLSMGLMLSVVSVGTVILQRAINSLGVLVIAGHMAVRKINSFCMMPLFAVAVALSTFVSQNKGADQPDRIRKAVRCGNWIALGWGVLMVPVLLLTSSHLVRFISGSGEAVVIENGSRYLTFHAFFYMVLGVLFNLRFTLQAIGEKVMPLISSVIELIGKIIFAMIIVPALGYFGVILCEPLIWCAMTAQLLLSYYTNPFIRGKLTAGLSSSRGADDP
jgi:putative MATE family efflux protein